MPNSSYRADESLDVLDAEAERDDHGDAEDTVQGNTPHHSLGQLDRSILHLLAHVSPSIGTNEAPNSRCQANESAEALRMPSTAIVELGEDLGGRRVVRHDPEDQQKRKESKDVREEDDAFCQRKMVCTPDVESDDREGEGKHKQSGLPIRRECSVRVTSGDELLDDTC